MNFTKSLSEYFQDVFAVRSLGLHWLVAAEHPFDLSGVKLDGKSASFQHVSTMRTTPTDYGTMVLGPVDKP